MKRCFFIVICLLIFSGCQEEPRTTPDNRGNQSLDVDLTKLSTQSSIDQTYANEAKDYLKNIEDITAIQAVNTNDQMMITIEIDYLKRFELETKRKELVKQLKETFPHLEVFVSTDQKIILELEQVEQALQQNQLSKTELEKKIKELMDLAKEET